MHASVAGRRLPRTVAALAWWAFILLLSTRSGNTLRGWVWWLPSGVSDLSLGHVVLFGILALLVHSAIEAYGLRKSQLPTLLVIALAGGIDEWVQGAIPGRSASLTDWLFDLAGALLGLGLVAVQRRFGKAISR